MVNGFVCIKYAKILVVAALLIGSGLPAVKSARLDITQDNASFDLLIISPQIFSKYLQPLVEHKNSHGVKTKLVTTSQIYYEMRGIGRDRAEKMKDFIKEAIEKWNIKYVLLVGGRKDQSKKESWWVPVRYTHLERKYEKWLEKKFLTDLYYADIYDKNGNFSSWDDNNNGIFGEWPENKPAVDIPDLYPDVYVGRLPCRNIFDVMIVVKKIIDYESTCHLDTDWFKRMVVVGGDTYEKTDYLDGEVYTQQAIEMMDGFEPVKLWVSTGTLKNWRDIVKTLNKGCGFVYFSGHGNPCTWSTCKPGNEKKRVGRFKIRHMVFLANGKKLPVCIAGSGCFVNMFNVSLGHSEWVYWQGWIPYNVPRCWGWSLVRKIGGGCIAVIGSTGFSYESPDISSNRGGCEWLDIHFFEQYGRRNITVLGECWGKTITSFLQNFTIDWTDCSDDGDALIAKNVEQWLLIGDPSLRIGGYPE
ncbi:MAG TPA: hypothetical protein ENG74_02425 [Thermoplasmatales archaeon]|nr:hypothetical protein [Thermoplasmatales archaeon]